MADPGSDAVPDRADRWAAVRRRVGSLEVVALLDGLGPFFTSKAEAFPDATAQHWQQARGLDPEAFGVDDKWQLAFRCFAIRDGDRITVVDTGIGPAGGLASSWAPVPGRLPAAASEAGIDLDAVDQVVLTHLHSDHLGWSVLPDGAPLFPNAAYTVQAAEVAALSAEDVVQRSVLEPLRAKGMLRIIDGRTRLAGGSATAPAEVTAIPTPGHTPGHQSVLVESGRARMFITGDALVHAVQLIDPEVSYLFEDDLELARRSRRGLLDDAREAGATLATAHLHRPFLDEWPGGVD